MGGQRRRLGGRDVEGVRGSYEDVEGTEAEGARAAAVRAATEEERTKSETSAAGSETELLMG